MPIRSNTIALAKVLNKLAVDLRVEIDIKHSQFPEVEDAYAVLLAARCLTEHGIAIKGIELVDDHLIYVSKIPLSDYKNGEITVALTFDKEFTLLKSSVGVCTGKAMFNDVLSLAGIDNLEAMSLTFVDVDIAMLVPTTAILTELAECIYGMLFNSEYMPDMFNLIMGELTVPDINRALCINGQAYTVLPLGEVNVVDPETGIMDLILVQAFQLIGGYPAVTNIDLVLDEESGLLCFDTE